MDLGLTESQQMLRSSAREFLEQECPLSYVRDAEGAPPGHIPGLWRKLADLGWLGLPFPEELGGTGGDLLDFCVVVEEAGRALLPGPLISTVVLAGSTILDAGTEEQKAELLPKIANGDLVATLALTEAGARWDAAGIRDVRAIRRSGELTVNGRKLFVQDAAAADCLLVAARTRTAVNPERGITLLIIPANAPGIQLTPLKTLASDQQSEVVFTNVRVPQSAALGELGEAWAVVQRTLQRAAAVKACEMLGSAQRILEMTVEYVKNRLQFGRPIGSFQAIQQHCANMAVDVEGARYVAYRAAWKLAQGEDAATEVAMSKAWVSDAVRRVGEVAHQCHGAIGFTQEYDLQLFTRRTRLGEFLYGDADFHRETVAASMGI